MRDPFFFGYGSLVNRATHIYDDAHKARLSGWRRVWVHTGDRPNAFLSVQQAQGSEIDGLIARVPDQDWAALDKREEGYRRFEVSDRVAHPVGSARVEVYSVPEETHVAEISGRIVLSYLDVVVQGFLNEFGEDGVAAFFATTDGWHTPIVNDRAAPLYPRAQQLSINETALVDRHIADLAAQIQER